MSLHTLTVGTTRLQLYRVGGRRRLMLLPDRSGPQRWSRGLAIPHLGIVRLRLGMSRRVLAAERARAATQGR